MNRYASLVIVLAATIGLRAPLCAYLCSEPASATQVISAAESSEEPAHCHGGGATAPETPESNDRECDCDGLQHVLAIGDTSTRIGPLKVAEFRLAVASSQNPRLSVEPFRLSIRRSHLPPPDILLLKSTLLI